VINIREHVAILIDADNAHLPFTEQILKISEYYGELDVCRAYGDWKQSPLSSWAKNIDGFKIERVQVDRVGKNATDHGLLLGAGEFLGTDYFGNDVDVFILVSGDGDFASACSLIRERGKQVIVIGNKKTSKDLRQTCDKFYSFGDQTVGHL